MKFGICSCWICKRGLLFLHGNFQFFFMCCYNALKCWSSVGFVFWKRKDEHIVCTHVLSGNGPKSFIPHSSQGVVFTYSNFGIYWWWVSKRCAAIWDMKYYVHESLGRRLVWWTKIKFWPNESMMWRWHQQWQVIQQWERRFHVAWLPMQVS